MAQHDHRLNNQSERSAAFYTPFSQEAPGSRSRALEDDGLVLRSTTRLKVRDLPCIVVSSCRTLPSFVAREPNTKTQRLGW